MIIERQAVRAILLTEQHETLLMRIRPPGRDNGFWITPGGGLEANESPEDGLRRELREELGLEHFVIGPLVWRRQHTFNWDGRRICQREDYHVVHVSRFEPRMSDLQEASVLDRFRWWRISELAEISDPLAPLSLSEILTRYLQDGPPSQLPELEVLVD